MEYEFVEDINDLTIPCEKHWNSFRPSELREIFEHVSSNELGNDQTFKLHRQLNIQTPSDEYINTLPGSYVMLTVRNSTYSQWFYYRTLSGRRVLINVFNGGQSAQIDKFNHADFHCTLLPE